MAKTDISDIRNIAIIGHEGNGKTALVEAFLQHAGIIGKMGNVKEKSTISDYDPDEKEAQKSLSTSTISFEYKGKQFNILDVPGSPDAIGEVLTAIRAVGLAIVCVDPAGTIKVNTRRAWKEAEKIGMPRLVAVAKLDHENTSFDDTVLHIQDHFGERCQPYLIPDGSAEKFSKVFSVLEPGDGAPAEVADSSTKVVEAIVEADEELMEKYLEGGEVSTDELKKTFVKSLVECNLFPIVALSAEKQIGTKELLDTLAEVSPPPNAIVRKAMKGDKEIVVNPDDGFVGFVYKTIADEFVTRVSHIRILSGKIAPHGEFVNRRTGKTEKVGSVFKLFGKDHKDINEGVAGDIIGIAKIEDMRAGDTITDAATDVTVPEIKFPTPMVSLAVQPKSRSDEQKIGTALKELEGDDMTFKMEHSRQTGELVIHGMSDQHLKLMLKRLKRRRKVEVETFQPKIPYMETVTKSVKNVEYVHKKQSGGAGQFARVFVDLEPKPRGGGYEFVDKIVGGVIDQVFRSSVDKGIQARRNEGIIAGCQATDFRVTLVDGKTHPVDSKDIAFQIAGREVLKKAFTQCNPVLLEPVVKMEIIVPNDNMGDIMGDMTGRRGKILSSGTDGPMAVVEAQVPLAEIQMYQADLKSLTGGEGSYTIEFDHYDIVPGNIQKGIIDKHEKGKVEAEK